MMAKDVVRMRGQINKFYKMRAQMQSASMQMQVNYFSTLLYLPFFKNRL